MKKEKFSDLEKKEIIKYGLKRVKIILVSIIVALALGIFFDVLWQSIVFILIFSSLRRYAGGYHASSEKKCYLISFCAVTLSFWCIKYIEVSTAYCFFLQIASLVTILALSPVENQNRKLEKEEYIKYGNKTRIRAVILFILSCFFYWRNQLNIISVIMVVYMLVAISLIAGIIKNHYEERQVLS